MIWLLALLCYFACLAWGFVMYDIFNVHARSGVAGFLHSISLV